LDGPWGKTYLPNFLLNSVKKIYFLNFGRRKGRRINFRVNLTPSKFLETLGLGDRRKVRNKLWGNWQERFKNVFRIRRPLREKL